MFVCPNCGAKLPASVGTCTFCNELITPTAVSPTLGKIGQAPSWVWIAYYLVCAYYILEGSTYVFVGLLPALQSQPKSPNVIILVFGAVTALFGVGLLARVELIRGIMNIFCMLQIFLGLLGIVLGIFGTITFGAIGLLIMLMNVLQIATAAFMIYLLGETDRYAPNS